MVLTTVLTGAIAANAAADRLRQMHPGRAPAPAEHALAQAVASRASWRGEAWEDVSVLEPPEAYEVGILDETLTREWTLSGSTLVLWLVRKHDRYGRGWVVLPLKRSALELPIDEVAALIVDTAETSWQQQVQEKRAAELLRESDPDGE